MSDTFLVTGATRGIGRAICNRLKGEGRTVIGIARHNDPTFPGELYTADLGNDVDTSTVLQVILSKHDIVGLVNNAGYSQQQRIEDFEAAHWRVTWEVNVRSVAQCVHACVPGMKARGRGRIVNIGSRAALGRIGFSSYAATKAALTGLTATWALELATTGITVNIVAPGAMETEMFKHNNPEGSDRRAALMKAIPLNRIGRPEEVAAAVSYFLSDEASYTTGQTLFVCGGWSFVTS